MLKNNLNVFYHFLHGGKFISIKDNFGNNLYYNDSEEEEELPNYYKTYKENKGFYNEAVPYVKKNNDKFEVVGLKQFKKDKEAQKNILVDSENEADNQKADEFRKKNFTKKIYNQLYKKVNPDELKNISVNEILDIVKKHSKTKQDLEDLSTNFPSDEDEQEEQLKKILQNKSNIAMNDEIAKPSENNLVKIMKRNLNNNLEVELVSSNTKGQNTQNQKDIIIKDKTSGDIVGRGEFKQINYTMPTNSPFSFGLNKILGKAQNNKYQALPNSLIMASFKDGTGLIDFDKDETYNARGQPLTKKRSFWVNQVLSVAKGDIKQLEDQLKKAFQRGYKKGDFIIDQLNKLIEFKTPKPEKERYKKDILGKIEIDKATKKPIDNPKYKKPNANKFPLITENYLGSYFKEGPYNPGQMNEVEHLNAPPDWIERVKTTKFEDLQLKSRKPDVIEYLKENKSIII